MESSAAKIFSANQRDYYIKVQNIMLTPSQLQNQMQIYSSHISQFNSYKRRIKDYIESIYPSAQPSTYWTLNHLSKIWKQISPDVSISLKLGNGVLNQQSNNNIKRIKRWQQSFIGYFKELLLILWNPQIRFPIRNNNAKHAIKQLQNISNDNVNINLGLKDLVYLIKKIKLIHQNNKNEDISQIISNAIIENDDLDTQSSFISTKKLSSFKLKQTCKLKCQKHDIDVDIVKNIIAQQTIEVENNSYPKNIQSFFVFDTQYDTNTDNLMYQSQIAIKMEIIYANIFDQYNNLFKINNNNKNETITQIDLTKSFIYNKLYSKIGKSDIDFTIKPQINLVLNQIKKYYYKQFNQVNDKNLLVESTYMIEGNSKGWILRWVKNEKKYQISSIEIQQEKGFIIIQKLDAIKQREIFKQTLKKVYEKLIQQGVKQDLNQYTEPFYQLFMYSIAGKAFRKVTKMKESQLCNKFNIQ